MTPTRRKPTRRSKAKAGVDGSADARFAEGAYSAAPKQGEGGAFGPDEAFAPDQSAKAAEREPRGHGADEDGEGAEELAREGRRRPFGPLQIALVALLALLLIVEGGFCLMRWGLDDAADVQGSWYVNGSQQTVTITANSIVLADDVAYEYALDEGAKTITYEFGIMEGAGRYRFSLDRTQLAIVDGSYDFMDTLTDDISWTFEALIAQIKGEPLAPGSGEGAMLLTRASQALPSEEGKLDAEGMPVEGESGESAGAADEGQQDAADAAQPSGDADDAGEDGAADDADSADSADGATDVADDEQPAGQGTQFSGGVSDVPLINGGHHLLPALKA